MKKKDALPATLSFLLPGLGQLYQKRTRVSFAFFSGFTVMALRLNLASFVPIFALLSGLEALRWQSSLFYRPTVEAVPARGREALFGLVGGVGFMSWFWLVVPSWLPVTSARDCIIRAEVLADQVKVCARKLGHYPRALVECQLIPPIDPWGNVFQYRVTTMGFEILSLGPDGKIDTADDRRYRFR